jgi:hypothetical protein
LPRKRMFVPVIHRGWPRRLLPPVSSVSASDRRPRADGQGSGPRTPRPASRAYARRSSAGSAAGGPAEGAAHSADEPGLPGDAAGWRRSGC